MNSVGMPGFDDILSLIITSFISYLHMYTNYMMVV